MTVANFASRTNRQTSTHYSQDSSAGKNGISIAPPQYGIDFVDRAPADAGPLRAGLPAPIQAKSITRPSGEDGGAPGAHTEDKTGLPDNLKADIEALSNLSMDDVKVHYNSPKPRQLHALAYTQGTDIHVGLGQERYLPHEAWHVVQQKQGRVKPTIQMADVQINDDDGLEKEADLMGMRALQRKIAEPWRDNLDRPMIVQRVGNYGLGVPVIQPVIDHRNLYPVIQMRTWGEWVTDVWEMTTSTVSGWLTDIPTRLRNIFIDVPVSLVTELSPLITYIGEIARGNNVGTNLAGAAATLVGSTSRAALRLVFGVLDLLPLAPICEIINVAVNEHLRPMNGGEIAAANAIYGARTSLWGRVRVSHDDQFLLRVFSYVAGGGNWNAFIGLATYHMIRLQNLGNANANLQNTVHELGHMVQFDRRGATYTMAEAAAHGAVGGYDYNYADIGNALSSFNREQQCRIAEHGWAVNNGGHPHDYLGSLPAGAALAGLLVVQTAYNARLADWQANRI